MIRRHPRPARGTISAPPNATGTPSSARKLAEAESACASAGPSRNVEPTAPPSDPSERWPVVRTALALMKAEITGVVFLILVLGVALGAYAADYLQRRRHGGFRI